MSGIDEEKEIKGRLFDKTLTRRLLHYVKPYKLPIAGAVLLLIIMAILTNLSPVLVKWAIDDFLASPDKTLSRADRISGLTRIGGGLLAIALSAFSIRYIQSLIMAWVGERIIYDLRAAIYAKILRLPLRFFDINPVGRLMTRVTSDVDAMQRLVTDGMIGLASDLFTLIGITCFMLYLNARLSLLLLFLLPLLFFIVAFLNSRIRQAHRDVRRRTSSLNAYLQEMLNGMLTIQLFNREATVLTQFEERNDHLRKGWRNSVTWFSYFFPAMETMNALSFALVLTVGGMALLSETGSIELGVLVAFLMYIRDFYRPLEDLSDKSTIFQAAMASSERIFALLDEPELILDPETAQPITAFRGEVEFKNVWFAYQNEEWVLKDVSLHIRAGESAALVGATGSGKTSIISLMNRFYEPQRGEILIDGHPISHYAQRDLRKHIGVVIQDPFIFSGTIAQNIAMQNPEISMEKIREAATYVNAAPFIEALPNSYETELNERGSTLSTGQKQLIALARALAQNPDILLILDEATANIDTETERLIQDALTKLMKNRTAIFIAHRLSTIKDVDCIYVMQKGEIIERGSHRELVAEEGHYHRLYNLLTATQTDLNAPKTPLL